MMIRMLNASFGKWLCTGKGASVESCNVGRATLLDGGGGNGKIEPSVGTPFCAADAVAPLRTSARQADSVAIVLKAALPICDTTRMQLISRDCFERIA